jgi:hypothetical protein
LPSAVLRDRSSRETISAVQSDAMARPPNGDGARTGPGGGIAGVNPAARSDGKLPQLAALPRLAGKGRQSGSPRRMRFVDLVTRTGDWIWSENHIGGCMHHASYIAKLIVLTVVIATGCGAGANTVARRRAATDFNCPEDQLQSQEISGGTVKVEGCGKSATYTCLGGNAGNPYDARCTREGAPAQ